LTAIDDVVYYDDEERARDSLRQHSFFQQCRAGRQVRLKVGAQVCLFKPFKKAKVDVAEGLLVDRAQRCMVFYSKQRCMAHFLVRTMSTFWA
jgi:hypothetical protein